VTPFEQNTYSPVAAFTNTTFDGFESSCKQKLNTSSANEQLAVLLELSVAVHVTVVVPGENVDPDGGTQTTETPGQLSVATGAV